MTIETEELRFNTGIAAMMEFMNTVYKWPNRPREALEPFVLLLAPYAPHLAEELWSQLGHKQSLTYESWPQHDESLLVQVSGKNDAGYGLCIFWPGFTVRGCTRSLLKYSLQAMALYTHMHGSCFTASTGECNCFLDGVKP